MASIEFLILRLSFLIRPGRQPCSNQVPVPGVAPDAGAGILQRLELKALLGQPDGVAIFEQSLAVGRHEMGHSLPLPHVTMEP